MSSLRVATDHRTVRLLDGVVVFWVVLWCVLGVWTGVTLWRAADVGETISASGESLSAVGDGLQGLSDLPVVPERPGEIGRSVSEAAIDITARGSEVQGQLRLLGVFLGIALVAIPVCPVIGLYLPLRIRRSREESGIRRALREHGQEPGFERYLADRARTWLPYAEVVRLAPHRPADGSTDAESDRRLADAELARLGVARRRPVADRQG